VRSRSNLAARLIAIGALLGPFLSAQAQSPARNWQDEVRELLARRSSAVVSGDERAFVATMADAPDEFRKGRLTWFRRMRALPIGVYKLDFTEEEYGELTRAGDIRRHPGREVHVVQVKERLGFRGYDATPSAEDAFLTVVKGPRGWSVVADDDVQSLALQTQRHLWDFGPVSKLEGGGVMVVFHPSERTAAARLLKVTQTARARVKRDWPLPWRQDRIVLMIPRTVDELARILQTTFDLSTFVAFAAVSVDRSGGYRLSGARIFLHWPNFRRQSATNQLVILQHELTHKASFEVSGPDIQAFMDEGIAQYYGERGYPHPTTELRAGVRAGRFDRHLPDDYRFTTGPPSDIYLSYEKADHFTTWLGTRFGRASGARLYRAVGTETPIAPGTWRYHLDRACRALLHVPFVTLERDWSRAVSKEFG
jgi:hypothetical protein